MVHSGRAPQQYDYHSDFLDGMELPLRSEWMLCHHLQHGLMMILRGPMKARVKVCPRILPQPGESLSQCVEELEYELMRICVTCGILSDRVISCYDCHNPLWCSEECFEYGHDAHYNGLCNQGYHIQRITVTEDNKKSLFRKALQVPREQLDAEELIQKVNELDLAVGCDFELKSNAVPAAPLRLLRMGRQGAASFLTPHSSPIQFKSFIALSYCWHSSDWSLAEGLQPTTMHIGGATLPTPVSKKMFVAFSTLRNSEEEGLWIDQLCVNQDDRDEKHVAVASMDILYRSARLVLIVLEDIVLTERELEIWDRCTNGWEDDDNWKPSGESDASMAALLVKIFSARWFSRVWCIHEHHVAASSRIIINFETGQDSIATSLDQLSQYIQRTLQSCDDPAWYRRLWSLNNEVEGRLFRWRTPSWKAEIAQASGFSIPPPPLMQLISMVFSLDASVMGDKLSVALNISGLNVFFKGNPPTADECCAIFSMLALAAGDATVLCTRGERLLLGEGSKVSSWMQWPESYSRIQAANVTLNSAANLTVTLQQLTLDLFMLLDRSERSPTESSLHCATQLHDFLEDNGVFARDTRGRDQLRGYISGIAAALDCGLDWMAHAWDILASTDGAVDSYTLAAVEENAQQYSEHESSIIRILTESAPLQHVTVYSEAKFRKMVLNFIFAHYNSDESADASIATGIDGQRGVYRSGPGTALAVPVVLAGPQYSIYERLWFLERVKGMADDCWRIRDKSSLFGCRAISHDGQVVALKKRQRIVG
jgi:hypothetical protein